MAFTWRPRELSYLLKKWLILRKIAIRTVYIRRLRDSFCRFRVSLPRQRHDISFGLNRYPLSFRSCVLHVTFANLHLSFVRLRSSPSAFSGWPVHQPLNYFITCYTVLTRPNKFETAVHGCNSWLLVWTLPNVAVMLFFYVVSALHHFVPVFLFLLQILREPAEYSFLPLCIIVFRLKYYEFFWLLARKNFRASIVWFEVS